MHKIYKYPYIDGKVTLPKNAIILRTDHVDDGFYLGDFCWAIVNIDEKELQTVELPLGFSTAQKPDFSSCCRIQLAVKEKQEIECIGGTPVYAEEYDGKMYIYHIARPPLYATHYYKIAVYKTGQPIDIDINKLQYLGLCRLWIAQELGLYVFLIKE